jgi:hypothetical protein
MESSRDSSVWQTLAVTFGGGLALGAVGMKLTQNARRPGEAPPEPAGRPAPDRLEQLEQRLLRLERAPAPSPSPQMAHQVLEAIVGAVDVKLQEQLLKFESRFTAIEAKMAADLEAMRAQTTAHDDANKARVKEVESQFLEQMLVLRTAVVDELNHFGEAVSTLIADQVAVEMNARTASLDQTVQQTIAARMGAAADAAVAACMAETLAPLRTEVEQKERELAEIKERLRESEHNVLEVILAIGQVCRQAAERISGPSQPASGASSETMASTPAAAGPTPIITAPITPAPPTVETSSSTGVEPPNFTQRGEPGRLWRIPLVSSLLLSTTGYLLLHYLR